MPWCAPLDTTVSRGNVAHALVRAASASERPEIPFGRRRLRDIAQIFQLPGPAQSTARDSSHSAQLRNHANFALAGDTSASLNLNSSTFGQNQQALGSTTPIRPKLRKDAPVSPTMPFAMSRTYSCGRNDRYTMLRGSTGESQI